MTFAALPFTWSMPLMSDPVLPAAKPAKKSALSYLTWWRTDPAEISKQVAEYSTLKVWQSARGISMLFCALSVAATVLLGRFMSVSGSTIIIEAVIWGILGALMFRGTRWAFIVGMVLWTFEKGFLLFGGVSSGGAPVLQVIWWAIYMNAFMLGFRVEKARRLATSAVAAA